MRAQKLQCDPQPALRDPGLHLGAHARFRMPHTAVCGDGLGTLAMFPQGDWSMGGGSPAPQLQQNKGTSSPQPHSKGQSCSGQPLYSSSCGLLSPQPHPGLATCLTPSVGPLGSLGLTPLPRQALRIEHELDPPRSTLGSRQALPGETQQAKQDSARRRPACTATSPCLSRNQKRL